MLNRKETRQRAQTLRKEPTDAENHLWYDFLRDYPVQFRRQVPVGPWFADFFCHRAQLVVEVDGGQHYTPEGLEKDRLRTAWMEQQGILVLRFSDYDLFTAFEGVCNQIELTLQARLADQSPSPWGKVPAQQADEGPGKISAEHIFCAVPHPVLRTTLPHGEGYGAAGFFGGSMKEITLYTDGACSGNPGPGGWGAILSYKGLEKELSGGDAMTTNNKMELSAAIFGLEALKEPCLVDLYTDSRYLVDALEKGWLRGWKKNGWRKSDKSPVLNRDLWERLDLQLERHEVRFHWVKGHAENPWNNRCDALAVAESKKFK